MEKYQDRFFEEIKEAFKKMGVSVVLFDFDDTLIHTQELFKKYMDEFIQAVSDETGLPANIVRDDLERLNDEQYKKQGVNPERWLDVVYRMMSEKSDYGNSPINNLSVLKNIYTDEPRLKSGVVAILEILKRVDIRMALVTHANEEWTWRKLESTGIADYFEVIKIVDENKHKGVVDWMEVVGDMKVLPSECLVLGDSLGGDIIPGAEIGAKTMWLHRGSTWSMYRTGQVPESTLHLDEPNQLLSALELFGVKY